MNDTSKVVTAVNSVANCKYGALVIGGVFIIGLVLIYECSDILKVGMENGIDVNVNINENSSVSFVKHESESTVAPKIRTFEKVS